MGLNNSIEKLNLGKQKTKTSTQEKNVTSIL